MKIRTLSATLILCSHLLAATAFAKTIEIAPSKRAGETVIVPYDSSKPLAGQNPTQLYVPYERFLELWEKAKLNRAGIKSLPAQTTFALNSARYEGRVEKERVVVTATIELATFDNPWIKVPLAFTGVNIGSLALDGKPAVFAGDSILVEKPGSHTVTAQFEIPLPKNGSDFKWGVPRTTATRVKLALPEARWTAKIQPDCAVVEQMEGETKFILAALGTVDEVRVSIVESASVARVMEPASATVETAVLALPSFESVHARLQYEFPGGQQERLTVSFDKDLTLIKVDAPGMKSWHITEAGDRQTLEVSLNTPAKDRLAFKLHFERATGTAGSTERVAPVIRPIAKRVGITTALYSVPGVKIKPLPSAGLRQAEAIFHGEGQADSQGAWTGDGALKYTVTISAPKHEARVDTVYQVNRRKIELVSSFQLLSKNSPLFDVSLTLPEHFEVQGVESERLQDWWREGGKLRVRFKGSTPESTPLVVYLVRLFDTAPQQLDVQPVIVDGFAKVSGAAVIAAHKGVDATLKLSSENNAAKEIDPTKAATSFDILPPLERKRGFLFKTQSFTGQVTLSTVPAKADVIWMLHAQAHETWASLSMKTEITLRQGSMDQLTFTLPSSFPEARVSGSEVRETRSRVEKDVRIYDVAFQNDIHESADFTVDMDVPMQENKTAGGGAQINELQLPSPAFPSAQIVTGYVLADNASESEMKLHSDGVDRVTATGLPWLPALSKSAGIFRVQPKWAVKLAVERLEKAGSRAAFCAWADMTTAVRNDGTEWHKAVWHLQNRSLQFLPVKLPEDAELMSVRVAGQNVRADAGTVSGQKAILVPLIKTRPGDISFDVEMVWRRTGKTPGKKDVRRFDDAELLGITVEQTFWNVWLPENRTLTKMEGNMQEAVEALNKAEKSSSLLDELKSLNKLLSSAVGGKTRKRAQATFDSKWDALNKDLKEQTESRGKYGQKVNLPELKNKKQAEAMVEEAGKKVSALEVELKSQYQANRKLNADAGTDGRQNDSDAEVDEKEGSEYAGFLQFGSHAQSEQTRQDDGSLQLDATSGLNFRWEKNKASASKPAQIQLQSAGENQLLVNDNIVLNQQAVARPLPAKKPASKDEVGFYKMDLAPIPGAADAAVETKEATKLFSSARGNVAQQKSNFNEPAASPNGWRNNAKGSFRVAPSAVASSGVGGQSVNRSRIRTDTNAVPVQSPAAPSAPAPANAPAPPPGRQAADEARHGDIASLQTAGRISLAVDFPLEGKVYHFKKVKANAALAISFADSKTGNHWRNTLLFSLLALALWAFCKWRERRMA